MDPENENFMSALSNVMAASQYLGEAAAMANATMSHFLDLFNEDKEKCLLHIVEDIEEIEKIISQTKDAVPLIVKIKETIFKSKRDLRKYIALQRDLEKLGYNDLFKSAAKLDALAS